MYKLASHPLLAKHSDEITAEVERFKQTAAMNLLLPLLHLDSGSRIQERYCQVHKFLPQGSVCEGRIQIPHRGLDRMSD